MVRVQVQFVLHQPHRYINSIDIQEKYKVYYDIILTTCCEFQWSPMTHPREVLKFALCLNQLLVLMPTCASFRDPHAPAIWSWWHPVCIARSLPCCVVLWVMQQQIHYYGWYLICARLLWIQEIWAVPKLRLPRSLLNGNEGLYSDSASWVSSGHRADFRPSRGTSFASAPRLSGDWVQPQ